jgi:tetratricopeptide (TPR) repeat protein
MAAEMELDLKLYEKIKEYSAAGEELFYDGRFSEALVEYNTAFDLIPEPKNRWEASVWLIAAMGDCHFWLKDFGTSLEYFRKLMVEYEEYANPFTRLRYGECLYETGNEQLAKEHLLAAYSMEGEELFEDCDKKYLSIISSLL